MRWKVLKERTALDIEEAMNDFTRREAGTLVHFGLAHDGQYVVYVAVFQYCPR